MSIPTPPIRPESDLEQKVNKEVVSFLNDMIDALTWKRVGLLCLLATCLITLLIVFENRTNLFNKIFSDAPLDTITTPWELSQSSKDELSKLVNSQSVVGGASVTEVNLKKNRRVVKYWEVKDPVLRGTVSKVITSALPQAFFNDDRKNNDQMLIVLDNKFHCVKTEDTIYMRFIPDLPKTLPYICRLAVPPFAGQFAGYATLLLTRKPSEADTEALKIELARISIEMYLRDVDRRGHG